MDGLPREHAATVFIDRNLRCVSSGSISVLLPPAPYALFEMILRSRRPLDLETASAALWPDPRHRPTIWKPLMGTLVRSLAEELRPFGFELALLADTVRVLRRPADIQIGRPTSLERS